LVVQLLSLKNNCSNNSGIWVATDQHGISGLGALPFAFVRRTDGATLHVCSASAAGMMLGASAVLLWEAWACDSSATKVCN
jgi:hypothetical protein